VTDDELALVARMAFYDATKHSADPWPAVAVAVRAKVIKECVNHLTLLRAKNSTAGPEWREGNMDAVTAIRALGEKK